ncbi:MDR family NADP-dependent oxidoreductase [Streptomyces katrae]|uniref:Alcohol dehydrogenase n=1 Tax=Streptomyces katrae TaxID=68223 RepID=A0A0F4JNG3_9ACTN|nr:NADP-dependent oxidoreductase [Streptomyces katrae]KJY35379.1 alcohol dehydrogenase [Streptomyces katrae]
MPTTVLPRTAREVRLVARPDGLPAPRHFTVTRTPLPEPGPGQVLVRNEHFLVFPGLRTLIGGETDGLPLPLLQPGDTLFGPAVGEVLAAPADGPLRPGDRVAHLAGWRDHALLPATEVSPLDPALPTAVAHLAQGSAAYGALTRLAPVRAGDVVLVTGAAGAVGTLAGQIARLLGAARILGSTGSPHKADRLVRELGYDEVLLRGPEHPPFADRLRAAAPDGIDVVLDTVGGEQLSAALEVARQGARVAVVGTLAGQMAAEGDGGTAPVEIDTFRLVVRGLSLRGYAGTDHPDVQAEWRERFGGWLRSGAIRFPYSTVEGIDGAVRALPELIAGRHFGAVVVRL